MNKLKPVFVLLLLMGLMLTGVEAGLRLLGYGPFRTKRFQGRYTTRIAQLLTPSLP